MADVQINRWDRLIRRVTGAVGARSILTTTLEDAFPVIDLENLPMELRSLAGMWSANGGAVLLAVAGDFSLIQLVNPPGSGHLVVLESCFVFGDSAEIKFTVDGNERGGAAGIRAFRDIRRTGTPVATIRTLQDTVDLASPTIRIRPAVVGTTFHVNNQDKDLFVFPPGFGVSVQSDAVNEALTVIFLWRERVAEESELTV